MRFIFLNRMKRKRDLILLALLAFIFKFFVMKTYGFKFFSQFIYKMALYFRSHLLQIKF